MEPRADAPDEPRDAVLASAERSLDLSRLSGAERRVLSLALTGLSVREITERLVLSEPTVRGHLGRIYGKLGVTGRVDLLARVAAEAARDDPPPERDEDDPDLTPRSELPLVLVLVGGLAVVVLLSVVYPPAMLVTGPALIFAGWRLRRSRSTSAVGFAALWILLVGLVLSVFVLGLLLLLLLTVAVTPVTQ
jgi:DNA-binding CsgD family transcriptional regulator